jgi:hypothetical protein
MLQSWWNMMVGSTVTATVPGSRALTHLSCQHHHCHTDSLPSCLRRSLLQNRTYDRWWQARSAFGGIGGGLVNIVRQISTYTDDPVLIHEAQKWSMCMVYGEQQFLQQLQGVDASTRDRSRYSSGEAAMHACTRSNKAQHSTVLHNTAYCGDISV